MGDEAGGDADRAVGAEGDAQRHEARNHQYEPDQLSWNHAALPFAAAQNP
jgi:hypothetical protein